jgi:NAD(P)-dependent dehydrogenase (short-subunit alcohol dehydrogenase family)
MKSAALELGEHNIHNITVNALVPGLIESALTRHEDRYARVIADGGNTPTGHAARDKKTAAAALASGLPLGVRWIEPDDVAPAVVYLASDAAHGVRHSAVCPGGDCTRITR